MKFSIAYNAGMVTAFGISVWSSDRYGSLDGYIAHLREPGSWTQTPPWLGVMLIGIGLALVISVMVVDALRDRS